MPPAETDDEGRMSMAGKVSMVAVVGNEDGAHHVVAECLQALTDVGFSAAPTAGVYWVGEAMGSTDYQDLDEQPEKVADAIASAAAQAVHLAGLLRDHPYPPPSWQSLVIERGQPVRAVLASSGNSVR